MIVWSWTLLGSKQIFEGKMQVEVHTVTFSDKEQIFEWFYHQLNVSIDKFPLCNS